MNPTTNGQTPALASPPEALSWAMFSDHPFYPSVKFFATEEEARAAAAAEIADEHAPGAYYDESSVSVARVVAYALINTKR